MRKTGKGYTAQGIVFLCAGLLFAVFFFGETDLLGQELWPHQRIGNLAVFLALVLLLPFLVRPVTGSRKLRDFLSRSETRNLLAEAYRRMGENILPIVGKNYLLSAARELRAGKAE